MSETLTHKHQEFDQQLRDRNDIETWLAEVLDGSMRTEFRYTYDGDDLRAEDGSEMGPVFAQSMIDAEAIVAARPDLAFERRRRQIESAEYEDMLRIADPANENNTMIVVSDFPAELMDQSVDVGGYNVRRKQTMLRVISRDDLTGELIMITQSLDRSDRTGLEKMYDYMGLQAQPGELLGQRIIAQLPSTHQNELVDRLMEVYDDSLQQRLGGNWSAGRKRDNRLNTLDFVRNQPDLLEAYLSSARTPNVQRNLAAAMDMRYEQRTLGSVPIMRADQHEHSHHAAIAIAVEMELAGRQAAQEGKVFSGCGASIGGSDAAGELALASYGNKTSIESLGPSDQFGPLTFECPKGHRNTRPKGKLIDCCKTCGTSVKC